MSLIKQYDDSFTVVANEIDAISAKQETLRQEAVEKNAAELAQILDKMVTEEDMAKEIERLKTELAQQKQQHQTHRDQQAQEI